MAHGLPDLHPAGEPERDRGERQITFLRAERTTVVKTFTVAPTSRFNVDVSSAVPELQNEASGP